MSFRGSFSDKTWPSRQVATDVNSPVMSSRSYPKSTLTPLFGDFHDEKSAYSQIYTNNNEEDCQSEFKNYQDFFCLRKLVGRPRVSYAHNEKRNLDSIKSSRIDANGHKQIYNGKAYPLIENSDYLTFVTKRKQTQRRVSSESRKPKAKFVSSCMRKVRYDHLEYDRFMPPPELIDGPKVYCKQKSPQEDKKQCSAKKGRTPLWHHPMIVVDEKICLKRTDWF